MAVGRGSMGKHVSEEDKGVVSLSKIYISSYQSVVQEGAHPF